MSEANENATVNEAGTQDVEPAAKNNETKAEKFIRFGDALIYSILFIVKCRLHLIYQKYL